MERKDTSGESTPRMGPFAFGAAFVRRFRTAQEGATLVEVALTSSILFAMLFGIIMMCLALYTYDFVGDAARMGARYAIVRGSECTGFPECASGGATGAQIQSYLQGIAYPGIDPNNIQVTAEWYTTQIYTNFSPPTSLTLCATDTPGNCNVPGNAVRVTVRYDMPISIPFWRATTISMSARSQLVISQ